MLARKRLRITGRVQGVAFRASTVTTARGLGLAGWVANRADGSVEAVAEGDEAGVAALIRWCHQGPPATRVDHIEVTDEPVYSALPESFARDRKHKRIFVPRLRKRPLEPPAPSPSGHAALRPLVLDTRRRTEERRAHGCPTGERSGEGR